MSTMARDLQRSAVYAAEQQVAAVLDRGGTIDFFGSRLVVPVERRFADIASIQRYVEAVIALPAVAQMWPGAGVPQVRERKGLDRATYSDGVIRVPIAGLAQQRWAARESVVLHEVAHHVQPDDPPHGPAFCAGILTLWRLVIGPEAELLLRAALDAAGVQVAVDVAEPSQGGRRR